jgi:hypothetical protein
MCIHGGPGIGKSHLLQVMEQTCAARHIGWVEVAWLDEGRRDYKDVMRRIRDGTQPELFALFNDRLNAYTVPNYKVQVELSGPLIQNVEVLNDGRVQQSGVTVHVGHTIGDLNVSGLRPDRDVSDDEVITNLSAVFRACLRAVIATQPLVVMMDGLEKADKRVLAWLRVEILRPMCTNELPNLLIVLAGRESLMLDEDPKFFELAATYELQPFQDEHVFEYVKRRGVGGEETVDTIATMILAARKRNPLDVANMVNDYVRLKRRMARASK